MHNNKEQLVVANTDKELLLKECRDLLYVLEQSISQDHKESEKEKELMKNNLKELIILIEKNHPNLPEKYNQTIQSIKEKLWISINTIEKNNLSPEQEKAIKEIKKLKNADSAIKRASTYATVMDGYCL